MSKTTAAAGSAGASAVPAPEKDASPVWVVLTGWLEVRKPDGLALDLGPGRLIRAHPEKAAALVADGVARPASRDDVSIGEGQARDLTTGGYTYA
jgi:hypothetical protein